MSKKPACYLCHSKNCSKYLEKNSQPILKCHDCGLIFVYPQPSQKKLNNFYQKKYFEADLSGKKIQDCLGDYIREEKTFTPYLAQKLNEVKTFRHQGKILDVGCATGFFLKLAEDAGFKPYGVDISKFAVDYARKKLKLKVYHGQLKDVAFPAKYFDVVIAFHIIEHVKDPLGLLQEIRRILKPNGLLMMTTPNANSVMARLLGRKWWGFNAAPLHLFFFNPKTFISLMTKAGFRTIKLQKEAAAYISIKQILIRLRQHYHWHFLRSIIRFLGNFSFFKRRFWPFSQGMGIKAEPETSKIKAN